MTRRVKRAALVSLAILAGEMCFGSSGPLHLGFAEKMHLVSCDPATAVPCFRVNLNILDAQGNPAAALPDTGHLAQNIVIRIDNQEITPFYAVAAGGDAAGHERKRLALVLIDVSGSMNTRLPSGQTRFQAATDAAGIFAQTFQNGVDRVAIVPFASREVARTIRQARFAENGAQVEEQIRAVPSPLPRNNTALFSAIDTGLDRLLEEAREFPGAEVMMIVMTDGKNDVSSRDDPGLLAGRSGEEFAAKKVRESGIQVIAIGFGDPASIDEPALRELSSQTHLVQDPEQLKQVFSMAHALLNDRIQATFASPWKDLASLAGRTVKVQVSLRTAADALISGAPAVWTTPQLGTPLYAGKCDAGEMNAALRNPAVSEVNTNWVVILRPVLVFLGLGGLLLICWFWLPRLFWPDRYLGDLKSIHYRQRWTDAKDRTGRPSINGKLPTGFGRAGVRERAPADATIVQPYREMGTRTRLDLDLPRDRK